MNQDGLTLSLEDHAVFARIVLERAGIKLGSNKRQLLSSRLRKRMRALELHSYAEYRSYLHANMEQEIGEFINVITTNLTSFFRENHHFEFLREHLDDLPPVGPLRVWSAGCSTGEEAYSIAMVHQESSAARRVPLHLTGTDIDTRCVTTAQAGIYPMESVRGLEHARLEQHFLRGRGGNEGRVRVRSELRNLIDFRPMNLLHGWTIDGPLDAIFCRNVVIYFDDDVQAVLFDRFAEILKPDGLIFIGHSENLQRVSGRFRNLGQTIYRRVR